LQAKDFVLIFWQDGLLVKLILLFTVTIIYWIQKSQTLLSKELARNSVVVFEQAHNIDNTCIDSMSVKINRKLLDKCQNSITVLEEEIQRLKSADSERLKDEYDRLVAGLRQAQENRDNAVVLANPDSEYPV
jgi:DNA excision repair protein ERCC-2